MAKYENRKLINEHEQSEMRILVTGSAGFIGGYLVEELLKQDHTVIGVDNYSKYGKVEKSYDKNPNYEFHENDAKDVRLLKRLLVDCDHFIALAAMVGGITYCHEFAYDLLAENERITIAGFDAAIDAHQKHRLKKITFLSSSMVYESTTVFPTPESAARSSAPPQSTYGFQKLACEYFAQGAREQYQLPYTIIRPFNCVGTGEGKAMTGKEVESGNVKLAMSHVVPDLAIKILRGQDPLHILGDGKQVRHYIYGADLAKGIIAATFSDKALNEDYNISSARSTTVLELAEMIWQRIHPNKSFKYVSDPALQHDITKVAPDVSKAKKHLGYEATTSLEEMLDEVVPWIVKQVEIGAL